MDELLRDFLNESEEQLAVMGAQLAQFEQDPSDLRIIENIFVLIRAIEGACGFWELPRLERVSRAALTLVSRLRDGAPPSPAAAAAVVATVELMGEMLQSVSRGAGEPPGDDDTLVARLDNAAVAAAPPTFTFPDAPFAPGPAPPERRLDSARVAPATLDRLSRLAWELGAVRDRLVEVAGTGASPQTRDALRRLSRVATELGANVARARASPADRLFAAPRRLARDLGRELGKRIELAFEGGEVELERNMIEALREPLARLVANAVVHGVETQEARARLGKPATATVAISIRVEGDGVMLEVADDGAGLDFPVLRERAFARGLGSRGELAALSAPELAGLAAAPTNEGGLARIRASLEKEGGVLSSKSQRGRGVTARLRVPSRAAATPAFLLCVGEERFALARGRVLEIRDIAGRDDGADHGLASARPDGSSGIFDLATLAPNGPRPEGRVALQIDDDLGPLWIVADRVERVVDLMLRPLPTPLRDLAPFSRAALLPDGAVVLALDPRRLSGAGEMPRRRASPALVVFRIGDAGLQAAPGGAVTQVLPVGVDAIEVFEGAPCLRLGERRVRVAGPRSRASASGSSALVFWSGEEAAALIVDEIIELADDEIRIDFASARRGVIGVAFARGERVEILDPIALCEAGADPVEAPGGAVLIFEPDPFFQTSIARALGGQGHETLGVDEVGEAIAALEGEARFATAFIDLEIADAGGGAIARRFRDAGARRPLTMVGLAAHGGPASQARARRAGLSLAVGRFDRAALLAAVSGARPDNGIAA